MNLQVSEDDDNDFVKIEVWQEIKEKTSNETISELPRSNAQEGQPDWIEVDQAPA